MIALAKLHDTGVLITRNLIKLLKLAHPMALQVLAIVSSKVVRLPLDSCKAIVLDNRVRWGS